MNYSTNGNGESSFSFPIVIREFDGEEKQAITARQLHEVLEVQKKFPDWWKNCLNAGIEEGQEFITLRGKTTSELGGRPSTDYVLSIDCAKELAMVSRTAKGKEVRKYFIQIEKEYKKQIQNVPPRPKLLRMWADALEEKEAIEEKLKLVAPEVNAFRIIQDTAGFTNLEEASNMFGIGKHKLLQFLREHNWIKKVNNSNVPVYNKKDNFFVKYVSVRDNYYPVLMFTPKGLNELVQLWAKHKDKDQLPINYFGINL